MKEINKKWIEAANVLLEKPASKVKCPECGIGLLRIRRERNEEKEDIYLECEFCKKWNVVTSNVKCLDNK